MGFKERLLDRIPASIFGAVFTGRIAVLIISYFLISYSLEYVRTEDKSILLYLFIPDLVCIVAFCVILIRKRQRHMIKWFLLYVIGTVSVFTFLAFDVHDGKVSMLASLSICFTHIIISQGFMTYLNVIEGNYENSKD